MKQPTVTGDLISLAKQGEFDVIIQGCNCFCTMGAGLALQIKQQYPQAYAADCKTIVGDKNKLGTFTSVEIPIKIVDKDNYIIDDTGQPAYPVFKNHTFHIVNMYTQYGFNPVDNPCDYDAIRKGFRQIAKIAALDAAHNGNLRVGYPKIGAGLAGGNWDIVSEIINEELQHVDHTLVLWEDEP